ncbi:phosphorylated adaptor for RNA export isoform X2 [Lycorma delicatula]|uniref:phosphorylated adaptor for RNA export isoform X2 n=1 Tax=Lycorma delicatula TaxID=130591 RepID=UPI003F5121FE
MESEDGSLEDGEVVDYTPLERPSLPTDINYVNGTSSVSSDEVSLSSSDTEEDSDIEPYLRPKKQKLTKHNKFKYLSSKSTNKYNVWSIGLQEETLSENLVNCGVEKIDRSRNVESYDYQMKYRLEDDHEQITELDHEDEKLRLNYSRGYKRRRGECGKQRHIRQRSKDRDWQEHRQGANAIKRTISELSVTDSDSPEDVAKDIASKLLETKEDLILRVVTVLGNKKAIDLYNETKRIEEDGGMMVMNGSRRRTPGGVYLLLVKRDTNIPHEKIKQIFNVEKEMTQQFRRKRKKNFKTNEMKKSILGDELLPNLLTRSELELRNTTPEVLEGEHAVSNPPPSPATDCDGTEPLNVQPQQIVTYDDDFLQLNYDDNMELF